MRQLTEAELDYIQNMKPIWSRELFQKQLDSLFGPEGNPSGGGGANNPQIGVKTCNCVGQHHHGDCIALNGVLPNPPQGGSIGTSSSWACGACGQPVASDGSHTCGGSTAQPKPDDFTPHYLESNKPQAYKCLQCGNSKLNKEDLNVNPATGNIWGCYRCGSKKLELL